MGEMIYQPGDRVIIVGEVNGGDWDSDGEMISSWGGSIMTIANVWDDCYTMLEDIEEWCWLPYMIAGLYEEDVWELATEAELMDVLTGRG